MEVDEGEMATSLVVFKGILKPRICFTKPKDVFDAGCPENSQASNTAGFSIAKCYHLTSPQKGRPCFMEI